MLQILKESNFDFLSRGKMSLGISLVVFTAAIGLLVFNGLNLGIEFAGGTELQVKYADTPDVAAVRDALKREGLTSQSVTTIGDPAENEVYIRLGGVEGDDDPEINDARRDLTTLVSRALRGEQATSDLIDLNISDQTTLYRGLLINAPGLSGSDASALAATIAERRKDAAIFHSIDELAGLAGMTPDVLEHIRQNAFIGPVSIRSQSFVGPAVGRELMQKAFGAIIGSLFGMLVYIWIRFQLRWGFAAVVALTHDTVITLGLFSLFGKEMTLPVVAAFLTLIGYSVNDTVVVFDRIRENLRTRGTGDFQATVNRSINQTLSRTIITSGSTWIVVFGLLLFGGAALNPFAFVLTVGVLIGTYSSIFVASPVLVMWHQFIERRKLQAATGGAPTDRTARRVRSGGA